jgi:hypothetical protein
MKEALFLSVAILIIVLLVLWPDGLPRVEAFYVLS